MGKQKTTTPKQIQIPNKVNVEIKMLCIEREKYEDIKINQHDTVIHLIEVGLKIESERLGKLK